eukprot:890229-Prymnesium_polylepis.2
MAHILRVRQTVQRAWLQRAHVDVLAQLRRVPYPFLRVSAREQHRLLCCHRVEEQLDGGPDAAHHKRHGEYDDPFDPLGIVG